MQKSLNSYRAAILICKLIEDVCKLLFYACKRYRKFMGIRPDLFKGSLVSFIQLSWLTMFVGLPFIKFKTFSNALPKYNS